MTSLTVRPGQSMSDVIAGMRASDDGELTVDIPADASVLLTANEFRALAIAAERQGTNLSIFSDDPLRRQLALLFGIPIVNEIPEPVPFEHLEQSDVLVPPIDESTADSEESLSIFEQPTAQQDEEGPTQAVSRSHDDRALRRLAAALTGLALLSVIALGVYWYFFSTAEITVALRSEPVSSTLSYSVVDAGVPTDGLDGIVIEGQPVSFDLTLELSAPATGKLTVPDEAARGTLVLRNPTASPVAIEKGTEFGSFQGTKFIFDETVEVPGASDNGATPGEATASVRSSEAGTVGNRDLGMLTGKLPNGVYYSNRIESVTGGTEKTVVTVSDDDLSGLREEVNQQLTALAATTQLQGGLLVVPSSIAIGEGEYQFDHAAGDEAAEITVTATVPFTATAYDPTALSQVAAPGLEGLVPQGYSFDPESVHVDRPAETGRSNGVVSMIASVTGNAVPVIDEASKARIAEAIAGSSEEETADYLRRLPYVEHFDIAYSPSWLPDRMPKSADRIDIETE